MEKQTNAIIDIIKYLEKEYSSFPIKITLKFKAGELEMAQKIIPYEIKKKTKITDTFDNKFDSFNILVAPIDSFIVIESLRINIPIYVYNIFKGYGTIAQIALKNKLNQIYIK